MFYGSRSSRFPGLAGVLALLFSVLALAPQMAFAQIHHEAQPFSGGGYPVHFVHTATSANTVFDTTYINNPFTNLQPAVVLFVTPNLNPGGACGCRSVSTSIGVSYVSSRGQWAIFDDGLSAIQPGTSFNVLVTLPGGAVFIQTATSFNTIGDSTYINSSLANGNPTAQLLITQDYSTTLDHHNVGVWYNKALNAWAIFHEDGTAMTPAASFFVMVGAGDSGGGTEFIQTATTSNTQGASTFLDNSVTNSDPNALVFVTANFNPGGVCGCLSNNTGLGVWYWGSSPLSTHMLKWAVFNANESNITIGVSFNVLAFSS